MIIKEEKYRKFLCFSAVGGAVVGTLFLFFLQNRSTGYENVITGMDGLLLIRMLSENNKKILHYIFFKRMKEMLFLWIVSVTFFARTAFVLLYFIIGFLVAAAVGMLTIEKGAFGLPVFMCSIFPHFLIYGFIIYILTYIAENRMQKIKVTVIMLLMGLCGIGVLMETVINPVLLKIMSSIIV